MSTQEIILDCPFCKKSTIKTLYTPGFITSRKTWSAAAGGKSVRFRTSDKYEFVSGCSNCGKTKKEVKDAYEGKKQISHEERLKRIKESGLPTIIENKY